MSTLTSGQDAIIDRGQLNMRNRESKSRGDYDAEINRCSLRNSEKVLQIRLARRNLTNSPAVCGEFAIIT